MIVNLNPGTSLSPCPLSRKHIRFDQIASSHSTDPRIGQTRFNDNCWNCVRIPIHSFSYSRFDCAGSKVRHNHHEIESSLISSLLVMLVHFWGGKLGIDRIPIGPVSSKFVFCPTAFSLRSQCSPGDLSGLRV